jgi:hypothetical protein
MENPAPVPPDKEKEKKERLVDPVKIGASGAAAVGTTIIGSFFGDSGTLIGVFLGSVESGVFAAYFDHGVRKAIAHRHHIRPPKLRITWFAWGIGVLSLIVLLACVAVTEASTGKTLHGLVTNTADYGSTFSHTTHPPAPAPASSPASGGSGSAAPVAPASPSASASASSGSPATSAPAVAPSSGTTGSVPGTPAVTPSAPPAASSTNQPAPPSGGS